MNISKPKPRKAAKPLSAAGITTLFLKTAYDLKLASDSQVLDAAADLAAERYLSFVTKLDHWSTQLYCSTKEDSFRRGQLAALFQKYPFNDPRINRDAVALEKFRKSEWKCRRMNRKFFARSTRFEPEHMQYMRNFIQSVIGATPNMEAIMGKCDFGPGSSVGVHGSETSVKQKLRHLSVTPACEPVALAALARNIHYAELLVADAIVDALVGDYRLAGLECPKVLYNKITCVPKNAKTNRTIAIEPTLNGFIQKGIDLELRSKLLRVGIDLTSQALNQALARLGSLDRDYATLDLSAASDSISIQLVKQLFPPDWFTLLNATRSPMYMLPDGTLHRYEKFCSMGNGFCFPLETLIFLAASAYAMSKTYIPLDIETRAVYGDDIIVPQGSALLLIEVLHDLGFTVNRDKTFVFGDFRESCGADYFNGENVRPIYIKDPIYLDHRCYPLLNSLNKSGLKNAWHFLFESLPLHERRVRPYPRDDDTAITVPLDVFMASKYARWSRDYQTWQWTCITSKPTSAGRPACDRELMIGKLRGDLSYSETFSARFSERTRTQVTT